MLTVTCTLSCIPALRCRQRFSLLFYGFGSKRSLLEAFADETLTDGGVLACDGLSPGVNAKQVHSNILGGGGIRSSCRAVLLASCRGRTTQANEVVLNSESVCSASFMRCVGMQWSVSAVAEGTLPAGSGCQGHSLVFLGATHGQANQQAHAVGLHLIRLRKGPAQFLQCCLAVLCCPAMPRPADCRCCKPWPARSRTAAARATATVSCCP